MSPRAPLTSDRRMDRLLLQSGDILEFLSKSSRVLFEVTNRSIGGNIGRSWPFSSLDGSVNEGGERDDIYLSSLRRCRGAALREKTIVAGMGL